jgi:hypothetical protein
MTTKRWSRRVTERSNALDLDRGVFTRSDPRSIARSLKRSADRSRRRKSDPYRSAMSMLTFYINRPPQRGGGRSRHAPGAHTAAGRDRKPDPQGGCVAHREDQRGEAPPRRSCRGHAPALESLETLALGIQGKLALWLALEAASDQLEEVREVDLARLQRRARDQHAQVESRRLAAARAVLGGQGKESPSAAAT